MLESPTPTVKDTRTPRVDVALRSVNVQRDGKHHAERQNLEISATKKATGVVVRCVRVYDPGGDRHFTSELSNAFAGVAES